MLAPNAAYRGLARALAGAPAALRVFTAAEKVTKGAAFGCRMCGQCTLPVTGYACPATCPKQLRNGPCGGVGTDGSCEVFPDMRCVWVVAYERAEREGRVADLLVLQRPVDHRRSGQSAWVSYWRGDDEALWTPAGAVTPQPPGRTPHKAPQAPLRCPGGEDTPPEAREAPQGRPPAREARK